MEIRAKPVRVEKLYHVIVVDPDGAKRAKPYEIAFEKQEGADTFINAVVTTPVVHLEGPQDQDRDRRGTGEDLDSGQGRGLSRALG